MLPERTAGIGAEAACPRTLGDLFRDQSDCTIKSDRQNVVALLEAGVGLAVLNIRAKASNASEDRLAILWMFSDLARQRQQLERELQGDRARIGAFEQSGPLRFFAVLALAELDIRSEPARAQRHSEPGDWISPELLGAVLDRSVTVRGCQLPSVAALRVVRAADEGAEFSDLER